MANVASKDVVLYVNSGTIATPEWLAIGCTTSKGFTATSDAFSVATDCNGGYTSNLPADKSWSFNASVLVEKNPGAGFITHEELFELWQNDSKDADGELSQWKLESIDAEFQYLRIGRGFISNLGDTTNAGEYLQFDIDITGTGEVNNVVTT